jgi:hypothetical protein
VSSRYCPEGFWVNFWDRKFNFQPSFLRKGMKRNLAIGNCLIRSNLPDQISHISNPPHFLWSFNKSQNF